VNASLTIQQLPETERADYLLGSNGESTNKISMDGIVDLVVHEMYGQHCGKAVVACQHCGQWGARYCSCRHCGAPID
jgi:hypothetical protein